MKKNIFKKIASIALALAMILNIMPNVSVGAEEYVYVQMNVPYEDFYDSYEATDVAIWDVDGEVDAVSTATTSKFKGTTGLAKGTYNNDKYILGVTIPVAVNQDDLDKIEVTANNDYAYTVLDETPEYYSVMSIDDGEYSFAPMQSSKDSTDYLSIKNMTTTGGYGDYQITLGGFNLKDPVGVKIGEDRYEPFTIYGVLVNTDSDSFGMTCLENIWLGTKVPEVEVAWSTLNGQGLRRAHGRGDEYYQFDCNGDTITSVDVITDRGVYSIPCNVELSKYYEGDKSGLKTSIKNNEAALNITGIPSDLADVKVSVSGGLATDVVPVDGKVALAKLPEDGVNYKVTISSSNFAGITTTVSTPITDSQISQLNKWIAKGEEALNKTYNDDLAEHVTESKDMVEKKTATSYEANQLIDEMIQKVKNTYDSYSIEASIVGNKLSITSSIDLSLLDNASYSVSFRKGKGSSVLTSGMLTSGDIILSEIPEVGTEYTVTVVSDNYQDSKVTVVAAEGEIVTTQEQTTEVLITEQTTEVLTTEQTTNVATTVAASSVETTQTVVGKTAVKKVNSKKKSAKKLTVKLKKVDGANGYEIRIYTSKSNASKNKKVLVKKNTTKLSYTVKSAKLKNKKNLFVRARAYKNTSGTKIYGALSNIKKVKVTK